MCRTMDKFFLLMWKNFTLQRRHPIQTLVEIVVPLIFALLLVLLRIKSNVQFNEVQTFNPFDNIEFNTNITANIAWSPSHLDLEQIVKDAVRAWKNTEKNSNYKVNVIGLKDSRSLEAYLSNELNKENATWDRTRIIAGIQFDDSLLEMKKLSPLMNVTLRFPGHLTYYSSQTWQTDLLFPPFLLNGPRSSYSNDGGPPDYHSSKFLALQQEVSYSIIDYFKKQTHKQPFDRSKVPVKMQRFPYPEYTDDTLLSVLQFLLGTFTMLSFLYTCINTVRAITMEKEKQLKEVMKIMGLPGWLHWTAWFIKTFLIFFITLILLVVMMTVKWKSGFAILTYSNPIIVFFFLMLFGCASITFCFAVSVFFSKANTAAIFAGIIWFVSIYPFMLTQNMYNSQSLTKTLAACLTSNSAMGYGFQIIMIFEGNEEGIQWHNLWKTANPDNNLVLGHVMIMLMTDTLLYLLIALYVEAVFPGDYGVPQPWYFPFTSSYWCGKQQYTGGGEPQDKFAESEFYEKEPTNLEVGIRITNLRKQFSSKNVAVKNLSFNMYKDQITVLLGHNGAGKTTTMSMLTGMITPSGGTAMVEGFDIRTNIAGVRDSLGVCPQHNILFNELTVKEHLYFFGRLKGLGKKKLEKEIQKFIELLEIEDKKNAKTATLSGGMKRKLSVAIAMVGDSKVVLCDEPSAGMDPSARRALWNLLQSQKKDRTILLTTHFMDEADLLGDRIAIMADGELQCCGSSYFLKKKYGAGYRLIIDRSPECNVDQVTSLLKNYIPTIEVESSIGSELTYILNEEHSLVFEIMLGDLETRSSDLGVLSYGVSVTSFDEVFIKASTNHENDSRRSFQDHKNFSETKVSIPEPNYKFLTGWNLWANQFLAMLMKRGLSIFRSWVLFLIQNCIPVISLIFILTVMQAVGILKDLPNLKIELDSYNDPVTVLTRSSSNKYAEKYLNFLEDNNKILIDWKEANMTSKMLEETRAKQGTVRTRYITGATFWENNSITAWFNNNPYHVPPLALQLVTNAILKTEVSSSHKIQIYNHPLPFPKKVESNDQFFYGSNPVGPEFQVAFVLGFGMAFASAFYIMFYIRERVNRSKHLQFVSGVNVLAFWIPSFLCDLLSFIFTSVCVIITFAAFQEDGFKTAEDLGRMFSILLYFGFSVLPLTYLASYLFQAPASGFTKMVLFNIITGTVVFMIIHFFEPVLKWQNVYYPLHNTFLIVPVYSFCMGIRNLHRTYSIKTECGSLIDICMNIESSESLNVTLEECSKQVCHSRYYCCELKDYYDMQEPGIGKNVLISCLVGMFLFLILMTIEYGWFERMGFAPRRKPCQDNQDYSNEDVDVANEKAKIRKVVDMGEINKCTFMMHNVTKYYDKLLAVNNLCLGVNTHECFGLLGVNGAGKTTTFKMMTGEIKLSSGDAWVNGMNLHRDLKKIYKLIGYCPQFDALLDDLTCKETIIIYSLLRGISLKESKVMAEKLSREFDFHQHLHKRVKQLSGGNKRKLSTAVALVGDPLILYLDEPTTGMDAVTKRYLWRALCKVRDSGKCIILTSHSMEECEALCTRLAIMVNGGFKCLGSTQHLKSKFSEGYTLIVKVRKTEDYERQNSEVEAIEKFVIDNFHGAVLREKHQELLTFYIASKTQPWSKMFGIIERGKEFLNIENYSLGQSSLEQVFLSFTKYQQYKQLC